MTGLTVCILLDIAGVEWSLHGQQRVPRRGQWRDFDAESEARTRVARFLSSSAAISTMIACFIASLNRESHKGCYLLGRELRVDVFADVMPGEDFRIKLFEEFHIAELFNDTVYLNSIIFYSHR